MVKRHQPGALEHNAFAWAFSVFAFALLVRGLSLWELSGSFLLETLIGDAINYDAWARELAGGDWLGSEAYFQAPLYPHFLAVVYLLFGAEPFAVHCVQIVLGALSCGLIALAGWRWFSPRAGIAAGLLLAIYAPAIFGDLDLQKTGVSSFLVCLVLFALSRVDDPPRPAQLVWLGVTTGALTLTRENALIFVVILAPWLVLRHGAVHARSLAPAVLFVAGVACVLLPVAVRNGVVADEFHLTTSQFGPNFYIGNNPHADGTYAPLVPRRGDPRVERLDLIALAEQAEGRELSPAEVSSWWTNRALAWIRAHPIDWIVLNARKLSLSFNAVEIVDTKDVYSHVDRSVAMTLANSVLHFGILAPLAAFGVFVSWRNRRALLPLYMLFVGFTAAIVPFYVFARYRVALVPILMLFAGAALVGARDFLREMARGQLLGAVVVVLGIAVFCNWHFIDRDYMRSVTEYNLGNELVAVGRIDDAMVRYRRAIELHDRNAMANLNLGALLAGRDDLYGARTHYERALEISPGYGQVRSNLFLTYQELGSLHAEKGEIALAIENLERAVALDPEHRGAREALADLRAREAGR